MIFNINKDSLLEEMNREPGHPLNKVMPGSDIKRKETANKIIDSLRLRNESISKKKMLTLPAEGDKLLNSTGTSGPTMIEHPNYSIHNAAMDARSNYFNNYARSVSQKSGAIPSIHKLETVNHPEIRAKLDKWKEKDRIVPMFKPTSSQELSNDQIRTLHNAGVQEAKIHQNDDNVFRPDIKRA